VTKTERTRLRLVRAALELFVEIGYDSTTAAMIAARAGVTEVTFFRHFPSKHSVVMDDPYDPLIAEAIVRQPSHLAPLAAAIGGIVDSWVAIPPHESDGVRARLRIVAATPSLRGAIAANTAATEEAVTGALGSRGASKTDARIAAAAVMGALSAALLDWAQGDDADLGLAIEAAHRVLLGEST